MADEQEPGGPEGEVAPGGIPLTDGADAGAEQGPARAGGGGGAVLGVGPVPGLDPGAEVPEYEDQDE